MKTLRTTRATTCRTFSIRVIPVLICSSAFFSKVLLTKSAENILGSLHRYLSNIDSVLLWNLVTTFVKKSAPKFSVWPQLFKFLYQFTFWIVLIFLIFFLFLSPNLIFAFWNATWWHFKIFHKNLNLRFLFNNLSHWWKSKQFAPKF